MCWNSVPPTLSAAFSKSARPGIVVLVKRFYKACLLLIFLLAGADARAFTSTYASINVAGNFNSFNTTNRPMTLITDHVWQTTFVISNNSATAFLFTTPGFTNTWKETDQTWFGPWLAGTAEFNSGSDMVISNAINGLVRFTLNATSRLYRAEMIDTNAIAWTSRYPYVALAGNFNNFNTYDTNMTLVSNGVWQAYVSLVNATNPTFLFATRNFTNLWKESNQSSFALPVSGQAEFGVGSDISINGTLTGLLRFQFDEKNGQYRVDDVTAANQAGEIWINEIHYDHIGTDTNEYLEVAGPAGTALTGYSIYLYNGSGGASYLTLNLTGSIPNQVNGFGTVYVKPTVAQDAIQNGAPDGVALAKNGTLIEFLSYEGTFVGVGGVASGVTSVDIGVQENNSTTPLDHSLQKTGSGATSADFTWTGPLLGSPGQVNAGQSFIVGSPPANVTFSNLVNVPTTPGTGTPIYIEADVSPVNSSNLTVTAFFRTNGVGNFLALGMSRTGSHFRTYDPIPAQPNGTLVEYYLFATYDGTGSNSPSLYPNGAPTNVYSFGVSATTAGSVWINEIDATPDFIADPADNDYVELVGIAGSILSGWQLQLFDHNALLYSTYTIPDGVTLPNNTNGFGFYVIGRPNVPNLDLLMTNQLGGDYLLPVGGIRLLNEFGIIQQSLWYGDENNTPSGFANTFFVDSDLGDNSGILEGTGGSYSAFSWGATLTTLTPGSVNPNQTLIGGNTNPIAPTIVCPSNIYLSCPGATIPTANVASVTAVGLCGTGGVVVTFAGDVTNSGTGCLGSPKIVARTYRAVSDCATTSACVQLIVVEDTAAPVLTLVGGTQTLVNAGFESGSLQGWTPFGAFSNQVSATVVTPYQGFGHGIYLDPSSTYAEDSTGNGADGFIYSSPVRGRSGTNAVVGTAFSFDGVDDRIDIPFDADLNNATQFTVSVWARVEGATTGTAQAVVSSRNTNRGYTLYRWTNVWAFQTGTGSGLHTLTTTASVVSGQWVHLVGIVNGSSKQFFVNGTNFTASSAYLPATSGVTRLAAGAPETTNGQHYFRGSLDEVQFFNRVLTGAEVTNLFVNKATGTNVVANLKLNEAAYATGEVAGVYQALPASSGQTWSVSGYLMSPGNSPVRGGNRAVVELQYLNATSGVISAVTSQPVTVSTPTNVYQRYTASGVASAGVASVRAVVRYQRNTDNGGTLYFDQFTLSRFALDPGTNCSVTLGDLRVNVTASDGCGVVSTNQVPPAGSILSMGEHDVVFQATDGCGQVGSYTVQVSVVDSKAPVVVVSNLTVQCDAQVSTTTGVYVTECSPYSVYVLAEDITGGNGCTPGTARVTTRTLQIVDEAGFTVYATQKVNQVTTNAPVMDVTQTGTLVNAGFEAGSTAGWNRFGNVFLSSLSTHAGTWSVKVGGQNTGGANSSGLYQDLAALGGQHWRVAAWMNSPTNESLAATNQVFLKLEFMNASYTFIGVVTSRYFAVADARGVYQPFSAQGVAPAGTAWVRATMIFNQFNNAAGSVYVDDFVLNKTSITASNGAAVLPDLEPVVVISNVCSTANVVQSPVAGTLVSNAVTNIAFVATDACGRSSTSRVAFVLVDEVVTSGVPPAPTNVELRAISIGGTNVQIRSLGTNTWTLVPEYATNLLSPVWVPISNSVNSFLGGTNTTTFGYPVTNTSQGIIIRVRQVYP